MDELFGKIEKYDLGYRIHYTVMKTDFSDDPNRYNTYYVPGKINVDESSYPKAKLNVGNWVDFKIKDGKAIL